MPRRNVLKPYLAGGYYHVYNRGDERQPIFIDAQDYLYFTSLLRQGVSLRSVDLVAYCLMPNHFHLLVTQQGGIECLCRRDSLTLGSRSHRAYNGCR